MGYWKTKVLPKIQKVFGKDVAKKADAIEACKAFDESKDEVSKEFEEKKAELQPKVLQIFEASSVEIKTLVKEPKEGGLKKQSTKVQKFLDDLAIIEFPGSKTVSDASSKFGPALVSGPIIFLFEKVSTFEFTVEKTRDVETSTTTEPETTAPTTTEDSTNVAEKEIVVEEDKLKKEKVVEAETTTPTKEEPSKVEEKLVEEPPKA